MDMKVLDFYYMYIFLFSYQQRNRKLYIFGGQRGRECLSDFFSYDLDSGDIEVILDGSKKDDVNGRYIFAVKWGL